MNGLHLIADLHDCQCPPEHLLSKPILEDFCSALCQTHGLQVVGRYFHQFIDETAQAAGITGALVLAESHLSVHTWPEIRGVTLDVYVCNFSRDNSHSAEAAFTALIDFFSPQQVDRQRLHRGNLLESTNRQRD